MDTILYAPDRPRIDMTQSPKGGISFEIQNDHVIHFNEKPSTIEWIDFVIHSHDPRVEEHPLDFLEPVWMCLTGDLVPTNSPDTLEEFELLADHLAGMTQSKYEEKFLEMYVSYCLDRAAPRRSRVNWPNGSLQIPDDLEIGREEWLKRPDMAHLWQLPALIPQVWVNWIHYDPKDRERAERVQEEPFRVDFLYVDDSLHDSPVIIEIDGMTHFGAYGVNQAGEEYFEPSMEEYTRHLRKDRWLRAQGWHVVRISNLEVEELHEETEESSHFREAFKRVIRGQ